MFELCSSRAVWVEDAAADVVDNAEFLDAAADGKSRDAGADVVDNGKFLDAVAGVLDVESLYTAADMEFLDEVAAVVDAVAEVAAVESSSMNPY